jgi:hypothetical protein
MPEPCPDKSFLVSPEAKRIKIEENLEIPVVKTVSLGRPDQILDKQMSTQGVELGTSDQYQHAVATSMCPFSSCIHIVEENLPILLRSEVCSMIKTRIMWTPEAKSG